MAWTDVARSLARLGARVPAQLAPDAPALHAFLRSDLASRGPFRGAFGARTIWCYEPSRWRAAGPPTAGYFVIGHFDGGNYTVFVWDADVADPPVFLYDHEDHDDATDRPRAWSPLAPSLSAFLAGLHSEQAPPVGRERILGEVTLDIGAEVHALVLAGGRLAVSTRAEVLVLERGDAGWRETLRLPGRSWADFFDGRTLVVFDEYEEQATIARRREDGSWATTSVAGQGPPSVAGDEVLLGPERLTWTRDGWSPRGRAPDAVASLVTSHGLVALGERHVDIHTDGTEAVEHGGRLASALAFDGRRIAVGFPADREGTDGKPRREGGCVRVLERDEHGLWSAPVRIQPAPPLERGHRFGGSVKWSGPWLAVGGGGYLWLLARDAGSWREQLVLPGVRHFSLDGNLLATTALYASQITLCELAPPAASPAEPDVPAPVALRGDRMGVAQLGTPLLGDARLLIAGARAGVGLTTGGSLGCFSLEEEPPRSLGFLELGSESVCAMAWDGERVVAVSKPFRGDGHLRVLAREGRSWQERWKAALAAPGYIEAIAAGGDRLVFSENRERGVRLHGWRRDGAGFAPWFQRDLPHGAKALAFSPRGLVVAWYQHLVCYALGVDGPGAPLGETSLDGDPALAVDGDRLVVGRDDAVHVLSPHLEELAVLPGHRRSHDPVVSAGGLVAAASTSANDGAGEVRVYRREGVGYRLVRVIPEFDQGVPGYGGGTLALCGERVVLGYPARFDGTGFIQLVP